MDIDEQALAECSAEPIHLPSVMQQSILLCLDRVFLRVTHVSKNAKRILGQGSNRLLGTDAESLFGVTLTRKLRNALSIPSLTACPVHVGHFDVAGQAYEIQAYLSERDLVLELEPIVETPFMRRTLPDAFAQPLHEDHARRAA